MSALESFASGFYQQAALTGKSLEQYRAANQEHARVAWAEVDEWVAANPDAAQIMRLAVLAGWEPGAAAKTPVLPRAERQGPPTIHPALL